MKRFQEALNAVESYATEAQLPGPLLKLIGDLGRAGMADIKEALEDTKKEEPEEVELGLVEKAKTFVGDDSGELKDPVFKAVDDLEKVVRKVHDTLMERIDVLEAELEEVKAGLGQ